MYCATSMPYTRPHRRGACNHFCSRSMQLRGMSRHFPGARPQASNSLPASCLLRPGTYLLLPLLACPQGGHAATSQVAHLREKRRTCRRVFHLLQTLAKTSPTRSRAQEHTAGRHQYSSAPEHPRPQPLQGWETTTQPGKTPKQLERRGSRRFFSVVPSCRTLAKHSSERKRRTTRRKKHQRRGMNNKEKRPAGRH